MNDFFQRCTYKMKTLDPAHNLSIDMSDRKGGPFATSTVRLIEAG